MKQLDEAIDTLEIAVSLLEEATATKAKEGATAPAARRKASSKATATAMDTLFSPAELTDVKARLDEAIERLESALEVADGPR